jgi:hypothetical protein
VQDLIREKSRELSTDRIGYCVATDRARRQFCEPEIDHEFATAILKEAGNRSGIVFETLTHGSAKGTRLFMRSSLRA